MVCTVISFGINEKLEDIVMGGALLMFSLFGYSLLWFYEVRKASWRSLTEGTDRLCREIVSSDLLGSNYLGRLYTKDSELLTLATRIVGVVTVVSPAFTAFSVPALTMAYGGYGEDMTLHTHCPFELALPQLYEVFVILEYLSLALPAVQKLSNEFIMLAQYRLQAAYFKYLSAAMNGIGEDILKKKMTEAEDKLIIWIKLHQAIISNAHELVAFFSPVVIMYYLSIICIVAGGVFYQLNATGSNPFESWFLGVYMLITVTHLYVQCHLADQLTSEAENLAQAVYHIPWYTMNSKCKGFIKLIINMSNRPINIMAFHAPSFTLNKESFVAFMTNTVSVYMGFSKIVENSEM